MQTAITKKNAYSEDIAVTATGTAIVNVDCVVYAVTVSLEGAGDAIISISSGSSYSSSNRTDKVVLTDEIHTVQLVFPEGKRMDGGISATSNKAGVDIGVTYE